MRVGYGNRGKTFELLLEYANQRYKHTGEALIEKQHTHFVPLRDRTGKIVNCKVEEKATVDYVGRYGGRPIAFEAKDCAGDKIDLKRVEPHQRDYLNRWTEDQAAIGFVIVSFNLSNFYLIPWAYWEAALVARLNRTTKTVSFEPSYIPWQLTGKAAVGMAELPEAWKIKTGRAVALDYLATVKQIWEPPQKLTERDI